MRADGALKSAFVPGFVDTAVSAFIRHLVENSTWVAIMVFAYQRSGTKAAGLIASAMLLLAAAVTPVIARQFEPMSPFKAGRLMMTLLGATMVATAAAAWFEAPDFILWIGAATVTCLFSPAGPVIYNILPSIARGGEGLAAQNVIMGWLESAGLIVGAALGALALSRFSDGRSGLAAVFLISALLSLFSGFLLNRNVLSKADEPNYDDDKPDDHETIGVRSLLKIASIKTLLAVTLGSYMTLGALDILYLPLATESKMGTASAGYFTAAYGAGGLLSFFAARQIVGRRRLTSLLVTLGLFGSIPLVMLTFAPRRAVVSLLLIALSGTFRSLFGIVRQTLAQRSAPPGTLLRTMGLLQVIATLGFSLGSLVPWLARSTSRACLATALLLPVILVVSTRWLRHADDTADVPVTEIALLCQVPVMRSLRPAALEALARQCHVRSYRKGLPIVTEGETGQEMFVIIDGEVQIHRGEGPLARLERGDFFGEVAILRDRPRNASVTAATDVQLLTIPRHDFISFVGLHQRVASAVDEIVEQRS